MWQQYSCPFGCDKTHNETLASEALAYWYGIHQPVCPNIENEGKK